MTDRRLSERQIAAFQAAMEARSITGAADHLHISQPAVSRLIRDLEQRIGFTLFERRGGRILPTVEAGTLYEEVQRSFRGLDHIATIADEIRTLRTGSLQVAALPAIAMRLLPRVITAFSKAHPGISVSVKVRSSTKVADWVGSQQVDVGFAAIQSTPSGVQQLELYAGPLVVALPAGHRLVSEDVVTPEHLDGEPLVLLGSEYGMRQRITEAFVLNKAALNAPIDVQLSMVVCEFVVAGAGVGLVDPVTAFEMSDRGIEVRPFKPSIPYFVSLMLPINRVPPRFFGAFVSQVLDELNKNPFLTLPEPAMARRWSDII